MPPLLLSMFAQRGPERLMHHSSSRHPVSPVPHRSATGPTTVAAGPLGSPLLGFLCLGLGTGAGGEERPLHRLNATLPQNFSFRVLARCPWFLFLSGLTRWFGDGSPGRAAE